MSRGLSQGDTGSIGGRVKVVRTHKSLTQKQFASSLGIAQGYLSEIEKGIKLPSDTLLIALSNLYEINIEWLETGKGEMMQAPKDAGTDFELAIINEALQDNPRMKRAILNLLHGSKEDREVMLNYVLRQSQHDRLKWYNILRILGLPMHTFEVRGASEVFETDEIRSNVTKAIQSVQAFQSLYFIGDVGTGKTMLHWKIVDQLELMGVMNTKIHTIDKSRVRVYEFYDSILRQIDSDVRYSKRLADREMQVRKALASLEGKPFVLFIDDAHDIPPETIEQIMLFKQLPEANRLSLIMFAYNSAPRIIGFSNMFEVVELNGLSRDEVPKYIKFISDKAGGKLPFNPAFTIDKDSIDFFSVRDKYLQFLVETAEGEK